MFDFMKKCLLVTGCVIAIGYFLFPRYEMVSQGKRFDRISGKIEKYSDSFYNKGWHECK